MLKTRIIPCLQLVGERLVKTIKFRDNYSYIGDPVNTVRIFNELEVDELCFLDIRASVENRSPNIKILRQIADECFMPLSYGGGLRSFDTAKQVMAIGFEKLVVNSMAYEQNSFVTKLSEHFGAQAIVASIDVKKNLFGKPFVYVKDGKQKIGNDIVGWAQQLESLGAGEILLTSMDKDGTWEGFDYELVKKVTKALSIPVIANGGAGNISHIGKVVKDAGASAVALGSMVVYQKQGLGVLVNFPDKNELAKELEEN